ncbi:CGNR zinc finger domain-containing protein [Phyllobacterium sp. SB3]|uniref:CGNR zinc finger domain-containing protein n=1 Tax=Phyllobacterium sp. SB3 TaxID=3156073 RepID=UPI0032AF15E1
MYIDWNSHRFSGGVLALDLANTVIFRQTPERAQDRFANSMEVARFASAAANFRSGEWGHIEFSPPQSLTEHSTLIELREAINKLFRTAVLEERFKARHLSNFLQLASGAIGGDENEQDLTLPPFARHRELSLSAGAVLSALNLLDPGKLSRIKICPNCHWLYLDESRNRSRRWCDMTVCGNRAKAKRHYDRKGREHGQ